MYLQQKQESSWLEIKAQVSSKFQHWNIQFKVKVDRKLLTALIGLKDINMKH